MKAFFPELLDGFPSRDFLEKQCKKFHYKEIQMADLQAVALKMLPLVRREAFWEAQAPQVWGFGEKKADAAYEEVAMTLGESLDCLQDSYQEKGMLLESYMLETLASELLLQGYAAYNCSVRAAGDWHVARYHFPGSEESVPLEMLPCMLNHFSLPISCNAASCLLPRKSVVFLAELTQDERICCEGICVGCGSKHCPNRADEAALLEQTQPDLPLPYGYRRILGKW